MNTIHHLWYPYLRLIDFQEGSHRPKDFVHTSSGLQVHHVLHQIGVPRGLEFDERLPVGWFLHCSCVRIKTPSLSALLDIKKRRLVRKNGAVWQSSWCKLVTNRGGIVGLKCAHLLLRVKEPTEIPVDDWEKLHFISRWTNRLDILNKRHLIKTHDLQVEYHRL